MKKILSIIIALIMVVGFCTACKDDKQGSAAEVKVETAEEKLTSMQKSLDEYMTGITSDAEKQFEAIKGHMNVALGGTALLNFGADGLVIDANYKTVSEKEAYCGCKVNINGMAIDANIFLNDNKLYVEVPFANQGYYTYDMSELGDNTDITKIDYSKYTKYIFDILKSFVDSSVDADYELKVGDNSTKCIKTSMTYTGNSVADAVKTAVDEVYNDEGLRQGLDTILNTEGMSVDDIKAKIDESLSDDGEDKIIVDLYTNAEGKFLGIKAYPDDSKEEYIEFYCINDNDNLNVVFNLISDDESFGFEFKGTNSDTDGVSGNLTVTEEDATVLTADIDKFKIDIDNKSVSGSLSINDQDGNKVLSLECSTVDGVITADASIESEGQTLTLKFTVDDNCDESALPVFDSSKQCSPLENLLSGASAY